MTTLPITSLRLDGGTQTRAELDPATAAEYAEAMKSGATFPPVTVFHDGTDLWLADGFHRIEGARLAGLETVPADVHTGTQRDAHLYAIGANQTHGLRRSIEDKRQAVRALLDDPEWSNWSDREIAKRCGVSHPFVSKLRAPEGGNVTTPFLPETGHCAIGEALVNGTRWNAYIMPSASYEAWDGSQVDGDAYLYAVVVKGDPIGGAEVSGLRKPISRGHLARILEGEGFPIGAAAWEHFPVADEPDDEAVTFEKRWSWPHLLYASKAEWIEKRWKVPA